MDQHYLYLSEKLDNLSGDILEIKTDVKEIKQTQVADITGLKLAQARCDHHWGLTKNLLSWSGISTLFISLYSYVFGPHK